MIPRVNRTIDLPSTTDLGWPTDIIVPYVLGDFSSWTWASPARYYGTGNPAIKSIATGNAAGAAWKIIYDAPSGLWRAEKDGAQLPGTFATGAPYRSPSGEVSFTVSTGSESASTGSFFLFTTYHQGRLPAAKIDRLQVYALCVDDATVTALFDGDSIIPAEKYEIVRGGFHGHAITRAIVSEDYSVAGELTWCGRGSRWLPGGDESPVDTEYASEHARQILWRWAKPDVASSWRDIIDPVSWVALDTLCRANDYRTRICLTSRLQVRDLIERLLLGVSQWHFRAMGQCLRFLPIQGHDAGTLHIRETDMLDAPTWKTSDAADVQNVVRVYYDGYSGAPDKPYVQIEDANSITTYGRKASNIDEIYKLTNEAICSESAAKTIGAWWLARKARPVEEVSITLPLHLWAFIEVGDSDLVYSWTGAVNTDTHMSGQSRKSIRVTSVQHSVDAGIITLGCEHEPHTALTIGG